MQNDKDAIKIMYIDTVYESVNNFQVVNKSQSQNELIDVILIERQTNDCNIFIFVIDCFIVGVYCTFSAIICIYVYIYILKIHKQFAIYDWNGD